jgi:hypothetical protein
LCILQFTKCKLRGILIGTDRVRLRKLSVDSGQFAVGRGLSLTTENRQPSTVNLNESALSRNDLKLAAAKFGKGVRGEISLKKGLEAVLLAAEFSEWQGLTYQLATNGFIQGIVSKEVSNDNQNG